jgi:hypothetical protein
MSAPVRRGADDTIVIHGGPGIGPGLVLDGGDRVLSRGDGEYPAYDEYLSNVERLIETGDLTVIDS